MEFGFSDEQEMLRSAVRSWLNDRFPAARVAALADSDEGWEPESWKEMAGLGWTGLSIAPRHGGAGMGFLDEAVVFEELGRGLYPGPYLSTVALALPALEAGSAELRDVVTGSVTASLAWAEPSGATYLSDLDALKTTAEPSADVWRVTGDKHLVPDAAAADVFVVVGRSADGVGLWLVRRDDPGVAVASAQTVDGTRRTGRVGLIEAPARLLAAGETAIGVVRRTRLRSFAALALEAVGVASAVLELAVSHAGQRRQFDKPIGVYQAVSHQLATTYMEVELARSLSYWAAWCLAASDEAGEMASCAAKSAASDTAVLACERAIQVHGGMGFTWEHILHRYYRRALWIDAFEGGGAPRRAEVASALLDT